jgi:hypothetical protein
MLMLRSILLLTCFVRGPVSNFLALGWEVPTISSAPRPLQEVLATQERRPPLGASPPSPEVCPLAERRGFFDQASRGMVGLLSASLSLPSMTPLAAAAPAESAAGASPAPTPRGTASGALSAAKIQQLYRVIPDASPSLNPKLVSVTVRACIARLLLCRDSFRGGCARCPSCNAELSVEVPFRSLTLSSVEHSRGRSLRKPS